MTPKQLVPGMSAAVKTPTTPGVCLRRRRRGRRRRSGVVMRRADHQHGQRVGRKAVAAELFRAGDLWHAVEPHRRGADGVAGSRQAGIKRRSIDEPPRVANRRDDLAVAGAAAEHAAERVLHCCLVRPGIGFEQRRRGHQQAGRADAALRRAMRQEGLLQRRQRRAAKAFDRAHAASLGRGGRHQAGADRLAVEQHRAGAAIAGVAADLGAGQPEMVAQHRRQPCHRMDARRNRLCR